MSFANPLGLLAALSIPIIVILYLLKQQHEDVLVSSTFLWRRALEDMQVSQPWQRLKRNLLLWLQLLIAIAMSLAIARPFWSSQAPGSDYIVILDRSASMQAMDVKPTRFDRAKDEIEALIDGMLPSESMSIISVDAKVHMVANWSSDKAMLKESLKAVAVSNARDNMDDAISLAQAMIKEHGSARVYIYSDKFYQFDDDNYRSIVFQGNGQNRAVTAVSYTLTDDGPLVLSKIANWGGDVSIALECLADGKTVDVKEADIPAGQTADVYWSGIPDKAAMVEIRILDRDDLMADNSGWVAINNHDKAEVLLVTQRNAFLEKALSLRRDIDISKTTYEQADKMSGYRLYVFDGYIPPRVPEDGDIIIFNPKGANDLLKVGQAYTPQAVNICASSSYMGLLEHVQPDHFHIAEAVDLALPPWAEVVLDDGTHPLMLVGQQGNQRIAAFAFDLHDSDIPLKVDFPILMQNLLNWMLPPVVDSDGQIYSGQSVDIHLLPNAQMVDVVTPSGKTVRIAPPFPAAPFADTQEIGVYTVEQRWDNGSAKGYFTVQVPVKEESDLQAKGRAYPTTVPYLDVQKPAISKEWWPYLAWAALVLVLIEWRVYRRGY